jgi:hypothetical protein
MPQIKIPGGVETPVTPVNATDDKKGNLVFMNTNKEMAVSDVPLSQLSQSSIDAILYALIF